jgi:hypothetical protein
MVLGVGQRGWTQAADGSRRTDKGHRRLPKNRPAYYSPGSKEVAQCFADELKSVWDAHPEALAWLAGQSPRR